MKIAINTHPTAMSKRRVYRVLRGGSYNRVSWNLRSTIRFRNEPENRYRSSGFRLVIKRRKP